MYRIVQFSKLWLGGGYPEIAKKFFLITMLNIQWTGTSVLTDARATKPDFIYWLL